MSDVRDETARAPYYRAAESWAGDRRAALHASRRVAWIVAAVLGVVALVEGFALMLLVPLKTVVPYTLLVDRQTGYVQALKPLEMPAVSTDRALVRSFLVQYVIARESFDRATIQADYAKVALWSAGAARAAYVAQTQASDARSPLNRYPARTIVATQIKSVTELGRHTALVRFASERHDEDGSAHRLGDWIAVIRYRFSDAPMRVEDRFVNPLGFQVIAYRTDPETVPPAAAGQGGADR